MNVLSKYDYVLTARPMAVGAYPTENFVRSTPMFLCQQITLLGYSRPLSRDCASAYELTPLEEYNLHNLVVLSKKTGWVDGDVVKETVKRLRAALVEANALYGGNRPIYMSKVGTTLVYRKDAKRLLDLVPTKIRWAVQFILNGDVDADCFRCLDAAGVVAKSRELLKSGVGHLWELD